MNTEMINTNNELTLDQLDDVNGGALPALGVAAVVGGTVVGGVAAYCFQDSIKDVANAISDALS